MSSGAERGGGGVCGKLGDSVWAAWRSWGAVDSGGGLELGGGPICFGGCAPGTPLLGDCVVLVEAAMP